MADLKKLDKLKNNKHVQNLKQGFKDMQTVIQEGNVKLFIKQIMVALVIFLVVHYVSGVWGKKASSYTDQMSSLRIQQENAQEYETNKKQLMELEPRFPDAKGKNEWLLSQIVGIFKDNEMTPSVGTQTEDTSNASYTIVSAPVNIASEFGKFAELLARIENSDDFVKVSSFTLDKQTGAQLGMNRITMKFNTAFPKEKLAEKLFSDYKDLADGRKKKSRTGSRAKGGK